MEAVVRPILDIVVGALPIVREDFDYFRAFLNCCNPFWSVSYRFRPI